MIQSKVIAIGSGAISDEALLIFFDETATEALREYSIIQEVEGAPVFDLKEKGKITFGDQEYEIVFVGSMANRNLTDISHVTLIFDDVPEENSIENGIYLVPKQMPEISEGMLITYR